MSENKYTAADFAAAEFAKRPNGGMAARLDPEDTLPWRVVNGRGLWSWFNDYDMAEEGWVPVPSSPAKPTITAGEVGRRSHLVRGGNVETPSLVDFLEALGVTVVPDPEPTNTEKLAEAITNAAHGVGIGSTTANIKAIAERLDEAGVKAPGHLMQKAEKRAKPGAMPDGRSTSTGREARDGTPPERRGRSHDDVVGRHHLAPVRGG